MDSRYKAHRCLADGGTIAEAARAAGVTEATVLRWIEEKRNEAEIRKARGGLMHRTAGWNPRAGRRDPKKRRDIP